MKADLETIEAYRQKADKQRRELENNVVTWNPACGESCLTAAG